MKFFVFTDFFRIDKKIFPFLSKKMFKKNINKINIKTLKYESYVNEFESLNLSFGFYFKKKLKFYYFFRLGLNPAYSFSKNYKFFKYSKFKILNYNNNRFKLIIAIKYLYFLIDVINHNYKNKTKLLFLINKVNFILFNNLVPILKFILIYFSSSKLILLLDHLNNKSFFKKKRSLKKSRIKQMLKKIQMLKITTNKITT